MKTLTYGKDDISQVLERKTIDYSSASETVSKIISDVRARGDAALIEYSRKYDNSDLNYTRLSKKDIEAGYKRIDSKTKEALKRAHKNISSYHRRQMKSQLMSWSEKIEGGVIAGERFTPLESVGCYVPGGRAAYPSTVLMTVIPAKIAGVKRVAVASPPPIADVVLAAAKIACADEIICVGGAQAIAALAYGTESVGRVDKIVGPGNKYVTAAKLQVYGAVDIDMPAGPSEILIIADEKANPDFIASDIIAQSEHDPNAQSLLASHDKKIISKVKSIVDVKARISGRRDILEKSLNNIYLIKTKSLRESVRFANQYGAEHLELHTQDAEKISKKIHNAGAVFIGAYSPVACGDYASGANHVLPTGGAARFSSQLSVRDFMKTTSIQKLTKKGLKNLSETIISLAEAEGLIEHAESVRSRFKL
jgi:histidinol dehydrogenase